MIEESKLVIEEAKEGMESAISHLNRELLTYRTGKASPKMLAGITVDYYGAQTPLEQVANINAPEPRQIVVQPWEKAMVAPIMKEILAANLGFNPQDDGDLIRIIVPDLTEERRMELAKKSKHEGEEARISVRSARKSANDDIKKLVKEGLSEDEGKRLEEKIQKLTDEYIKKVDVIIDEKEKEIMSI